MCARFTVGLPWVKLAELFGVRACVFGKASWNVAPTQLVPVIEDTKPGRQLTGARWGLEVPWTTAPMINACSETAATKPTFRRALESRRCLMPATGFYVWREVDGGRQPYLFCRPNGDPFAFGGIVDFYKVAGGVAPSCAVLTTSASTFVRPYHESMPVVIDESDWDRWLDRTVTDPEAVADLMRPAPEDCFDALPVWRTLRMACPT